MKDVQLVQRTIAASKLIKNDSRFDLLNLYHVNLLRNLADYGTPFLEELIALRIKYNLSLNDDEWELDEELEGST